MAGLWVDKAVFEKREGGKGRPEEESSVGAELEKRGMGVH